MVTFFDIHVKPAALLKKKFRLSFVITYFVENLRMAASVNPKQLGFNNYDVT